MDVFVFTRVQEGYHGEPAITRERKHFSKIIDNTVHSGYATSPYTPILGESMSETGDTERFTEPVYYEHVGQHG